jgi:hypothetical protein
MTTPKPSTIKRLFAVSGNQCAFPRCPLPLVDEASGKVTGRTCHIKAQKPGGPRHDHNQSDEERHAFENLLILCPIHHDVVDSDVESYTVERLLQIKEEHEKNHLNGDEPSDEIAHALITISSNDFSGGSLLLNQNQSGGQVAHQITNLLLQPDISVGLEREIQIRRDTHDLDIFRRADSILTEDQLDRICSDLLGSNCYRDSLFLAICGFCEFFDKTQNQYLNGNLASLTLELSKSLNNLIEFLTYRFFVFPEHQSVEADTKFCLQPDLCIDRSLSVSKEDMIEYDRLVEKLYSLVNESSKAYVSYRKAVKERLFL